MPDPQPTAGTIEQSTPAPAPVPATTPAPAPTGGPVRVGAAEADAEVARQNEEDRLASTREWLKSVGMAMQDVRPREAARVVVPQDEGGRANRPEPGTRMLPPDVEELQHVLKQGDDAQFIEGVLQAASGRTARAFALQERDRNLGLQINEYVAQTSPELPLVVFWAFAGEAEARFPGELDRQINWAMQQASAAMEHHNASIADRTRIRDTAAQESETLDGTPMGGRSRRRRGGAEEEPDESMVETILNAQRGRMGG